MATDAMNPAKQLKLLQSDWLVGAVAALALLKLTLVLDQSTTVVFGLHDDYLYVYRAGQLLDGQGFGPYTSTTLVKYPGLSLWLALGTFLGIPYLLSLNCLYVAAGLYLAAALRRAGVPGIGIAGGFLLYLFNPYTFSIGWTRVIREPLSAVFLVAIAASLLFIIHAARQGRLSIPNLAVLSATLAFSALLREEDRLLYLIPAVAGGLLVWDGANSPHWRKRLTQALLIFALPLIATVAADTAVRAFISRHYGAPILHDFGEGEFPKLVAALRSVKARRDNRYVMISQETLSAVAREVPRLEPVIRLLPRPSSQSPSCLLLGLCTELGNGWLLFWIKDAAYDSGLTPDLASAQAFFRRAREDIESACAEQRLQCTASGTGMLPAFELRWTRALAYEAGDLARMLLRPERLERRIPNDGPGLEALYERVTGTKATTAEAPMAGLSSAKQGAYAAYELTYTVVVVAALALCVAAIYLAGGIPGTTFSLFLAMIGCYLLVRLAALSYLAIYMGRYDLRMVLSAQLALAFLAPCVIAAALGRLRPFRAQAGVLPS